MQGGLRWQWRYVSSLCEISMMWQWMQWTRRSASDLRLWMVGIWWLLCVQPAVAFFQDRSLEVLQRIFLCCVKVSSALSQNFQQWRELQQGKLDSCKLTSAPFFKWFHLRCCMERVYDMPLPHNAPVLYGGQFQVHFASSGPFRLCFDLFFHHACLLAGDTYHWSDRVELNWESGKTLILSQGRDERGLSFLPRTVALKVSAKQCVEKYQSNEEDPAVSAVDLPWCWYLAKPIWLECFLWALVKGCGQLYWLWHCSVLRSDIVVQCLVPLCHWQRSVRSNISFAAYSSTPTYHSTGGIVTAKQCPPRWLDLGVLCPLENCAYLAGCSKRTDALEDCIVIFSKIVDSSFRTALAHFPPPSLAWTSVEARFKKGHRKGESYNFASSFWRVSEFYYGTSRVSYIFQKYPKEQPVRSPWRKGWTSEVGFLWP